MGIVTVINKKTGEVFEYFMEDILRVNIDSQVRPILEKKDEDYIIIVDGRERTGKSVFAIQLARYVDPTFTQDRICYSAKEFRQAVITANPREVIIFDEAYRGLSAKGALTETNKVLTSMMMEMGQKNLFVIVVLPYFSYLERYVAVERSRGLFHIYKNKGVKGYWKYYNYGKKAKLYELRANPSKYKIIKTRFKGRFYGKYAIDETTYRRKKAESLQSGFAVETREDRAARQRNHLIMILKNHLQCSEDDLVKFLVERGYNTDRDKIHTYFQMLAAEGLYKPDERRKEIAEITKVKKRKQAEVTSKIG